MAEKLRVDQALVAKGLCESREKAQAAIMAGQVYIGERKVLKPSELLPENGELILRAPAHDYVSRGALKLEKAVKVFQADLKDKVIMDIGASTGGFTDVSLRNGARHVYSIDVGYGQLDWKLRNDERVTVMERTNARYLTAENFPERPAVTVMDVSFISIKLILPVAAAIMGDNGVFYTLIKPQFEAGRERVGKKGVVRDPKVHQDILRDIISFTETFGWRVVAIDFSPITGPEGNIEFLAKIVKADESVMPVSPETAASVVESAHKSLSKA